MFHCRSDYSYTLDGTEPTTNSPIYTVPIRLNGNTEVNAQAFRDDYLNSAVASVFYSLMPVAVPTFDPPAGPIAVGSEIAMTSATPGAVIRYTLDATDPTQDSPVFSGLVRLTEPATVKARAFRDDLAPSATAGAYFGLIDVRGTVVTTLAGTTTAGFLNGFALAARFSSPQGICVDQLGNLFVADEGNNVIRKISSRGEVTTFAGTGVAGSRDGKLLELSSLDRAVLPAIIGESLRGRRQSIPVCGRRWKPHTKDRHERTSDDSPDRARLYQPEHLAN